ncbi:type II toxin-antitoxin system ParD family antitoxin [Candidatus Fermentibacteria bacterium]|nr:type II toxin-antitoxin system ParD family antitoxin [Candidatus Fermentibacteria bacterium]
MNISLTPTLERFIQEKVASGRYASASEVVREALRVLEERHRIEDVRLRALRDEATRSFIAANAQEDHLDRVVELVPPASVAGENAHQRKDEA